MNNGSSMILVSSISSGEVQFWLVSQLSQKYGSQKPWHPDVYSLKSLVIMVVHILGEVN